MDLIYTNPKWEDVGVLHDYTFDLAFGADENDFELTLDLENHCCEVGCLLYIEGTEYGGIVDTICISTKEEKLTYRGRTWHGVFGSKIIEPENGEAYLTVSGEANAIIGRLIQRLGLSNLFVASSNNSKLEIGSFSFDRYIDGYSGLTKMLSSVSGKLNFQFTNHGIIVSALPVVDYSKDEQFDNSSTQVQIEKTQNAVNHLICLGKGELTERNVIHLYTDAKGNISENQTFFGLQEITATHDYPNVESLDELRKSGIEKLQKYAVMDKVQLNFDPEQPIYDVGDIISAKEYITGIVATEKITKKIVTISQGEINIQYKVGE